GCVVSPPVPETTPREFPYDVPVWWRAPSGEGISHELVLADVAQGDHPRRRALWRRDRDRPVHTVRDRAGAPGPRRQPSRRPARCGPTGAAAAGRGRTTRRRRPTATTSRSTSPFVCPNTCVSARAL